MERVKIDLKNCYGIKKLQKELDFSNESVFALYAPNGVMKSSLAQTFQDVIDGSDSSDRMFPARTTIRKILDENNKAVDPDNIFVVLPYNPGFGLSEKESILLVDPPKQKEYEELNRETCRTKEALLDAIKQQSGSKKDLEEEISLAFVSKKNDFYTALTRIQQELEEQKDTPFATVEYDIIFNDKVTAALNTKNLKNAIEEYVRRYNELLETSTYFKKGVFDYYNAGQIAKILADNGFFSAQHTVSLNAKNGNCEITTKEELEKVIEDEKSIIIEDEKLRKNFNTVAAQLEKNADLRKFCRYLQDKEALLACMSNPDGFKQDLFKSYLKTHYELYRTYIKTNDAAKKRRREIEDEAQKQSSQWERVINIFNERFLVPFKLKAKNEIQVKLGQERKIELGFTYVDGEDSVEVEETKLVTRLSTGEKKALYILNVIFNIETRKSNNVKTLVIVDDLADSFDYQNKYAIIQYLKDISEQGLFKLLIMTHNFDFFRTLESRFVNYSNCLMASKEADGITLTKASAIRNPFAHDWKQNFFTTPRKKIASIPFLRNLVAMTTGKNDSNYPRLTAMLHWKPGLSGTLTVGQLDGVYNSICKKEGVSTNPTMMVSDLVKQEAKSILDAAETGMILENKIVLAIAIRIAAEQFMINKIADTTFVENIISNQTHTLITKFKSRFPDLQDPIKTLDQVALMTPENIHVNSFMYEPIVDMSDDHLHKLYIKVLALN